MTDPEAYIALNMIRQVGPVRVRRLLAALGSPVRVLKASPAELQRAEGVGPDVAASIHDWESRVDLATELRAVKEFGARGVTMGCADYPALLRDIYDPPIVLYVR